jgi:PleD family two-component response regulator
MVICAVEDLMFVSKLRSVGSSAHRELRFVKTPEALLSEARRFTPSLVILDLNADRLRPLDMLGALRSDPALASVRTIGFVSHVDVDRMTAARNAGVDAVMARSAFVSQLPALLGAAE